MNGDISSRFHFGDDRNFFRDRKMFRHRNSLIPFLGVQDEILDFEIFQIWQRFWVRSGPQDLDFFGRRNFGIRKVGRLENFVSRPKSSNYDLGPQRAERASNSASDTEIGIQKFVRTVQKNQILFLRSKIVFRRQKFCFGSNFVISCSQNKTICSDIVFFGSKIIIFVIS